MTEPNTSSLAQTASEPPEESVEHEREVVGDAPDTGPLVTPDASQSAPDGEPTER